MLDRRDISGLRLIGRHGGTSGHWLPVRSTHEARADFVRSAAWLRRSYIWEQEAKCYDPKGSDCCDGNLCDPIPDFHWGLRTGGLVWEGYSKLHSYYLWAINSVQVQVDV